MALKNIPLFQKQLLSWYQKNKRDLPWRKTKDAYKIWVSEIMLQQTQVQTVIPYYERWLKRFPDLKTLSNAPEAEVMKHWAGLGYYRRARMLHEAAKFIVEKKAGEFPKTAKDLLEMPGIGRYTAGAIASIAYGEKTPVLDGNVIRILTRLEAIREDIGKPKTIENLWKIAEKLVPAGNPGDFNQAMMELGATVCMPQNPMCLLCPVAGLCEGRKKGGPENFPYRKEKQKLEKVKTAAIILRKSGKILIQKQSAKERWGGLWVFPFGDDLKKLCAKLGVAAAELNHRITIQHGFTKYQVTLEVYEHGPQRKNLGLPGISQSLLKSSRSFEMTKIKNTQWVPLRDLSSFAFPSPHQKIVKDLLR